MLLCYSLRDNVRLASDAGMYAQAFLLSLAAHDYAAIPQTTLSYSAKTVWRIVNIPEGVSLLYVISFGMPDKTPLLPELQGRANSFINKCRLASIIKFYFFS
ncbi:nitroreductase family protein [Pantoea sp. KXB25]|uniref:nitroreductase family protein n=2 Tax=unclassified Pantoea TaxID=2630326 RepID=UPI003AB8386F